MLAGELASAPENDMKQPKDRPQLQDKDNNLQGTVCCTVDTLAVVFAGELVGNGKRHEGDGEQRLVAVERVEHGRGCRRVTTSRVAECMYG